MAVLDEKKYGLSNMFWVILWDIPSFAAYMIHQIATYVDLLMQTLFNLALL